MLLGRVAAPAPPLDPPLDLPVAGVEWSSPVRTPRRPGRRSWLRWPSRLYHGACINGQSSLCFFSSMPDTYSIKKEETRHARVKEEEEEALSSCRYLLYFPYYFFFLFLGIIFFLSNTQWTNKSDDSCTREAN
jgi:hypothetical protein